MANLAGMFSGLNQATRRFGGTQQAVPQDPMERDVMQQYGVTNPMLQMFGKGLGGLMGKEMGSPNDQIKAAMGSIDMNDPQALIKVADRIKGLDPTTAMKLVMAQQDLDYKKQQQADSRAKNWMDAQKSKGFNVTEGQLFKSPEGYIYQTMYQTDKDTGSVQTIYLPQGGAPEYDGTSKLSLVQTSGQFIGLNPFEGANLDVEKEDRKTLNKAYGEQRMVALQNMPEAVQQKETLVELIGLIDQANAEGDLKGGLPAALQQTWYDLTGKTPSTLAELNTEFGQVTYSYLRELFGSQITEGERQAVKDIFLGIEKSGTVNKAVLKRLMRAADNSITKYGLYQDNKTLDDYEAAMGQYVTSLEQNISNIQKQPVKKRWNPSTGTWETVGND